MHAITLHSSKSIDPGTRNSVMVTMVQHKKLYIQYIILKMEEISINLYIADGNTYQKLQDPNARLGVSNAKTIVSSVSAEISGAGKLAKCFNHNGECFFLTEDKQRFELSD